MAAMRNARPVPGEIMTGAAPRGAAGSMRPDRDDDVVEAEFEIVASGPMVPRHPAAPPETAGSLAFLGAPPPAAPKGLFGRRGGALFWSAGTCLVATAFWVSGGYALVMPSDDAALRQAGQAFTLTDVTSRVDSSGGKPLLLIDGKAGNDGAARADLPGLEIRVASLDGSVTRYRLGTSARSLAPGERFAFSSRLDVPKTGVKSVSVTFAE